MGLSVLIPIRPQLAVAMAMSITVSGPAPARAILLTLTTSATPVVFYHGGNPSGDISSVTGSAQYAGSVSGVTHYKELSKPHSTLVGRNWIDR